MKKFKDLFLSKKFIVMIAGILIVIAARKGLMLDPDMTEEVVGIVMAYLVGQGIADHGKAAAEIQAEHPRQPGIVEQTVKIDKEGER